MDWYSSNYIQFYYFNKKRTIIGNINIVFQQFISILNSTTSKKNKNLY